MPLKKQSKVLARAMTTTEPILVTKFERIKDKALDCDYAEGFFTRDRNFIFEIFFDDEPSEDTYKNTRISEMYIKHGGAIQWSWGGPLDKDPDWDYGTQLLADLLIGIEPATQNQTTDNAQYCHARIDSVVNQLFDAGLNRHFIAAALTEALKRMRQDA